MRQIRPVGGVVTVTSIRDRVGENDDAFAVSWHSRTGDLCWLSPRIPSQESADTAAAVLADFTHSVLAR
jgi:protoheme ferro-lyase